MFLGHALVGFALGGSAGLLADCDRERALALGLVTAAFATAPDIDMLYALVGGWRALGNAAGAFGVADAFWGTGNVVHRSVTHSLLLALPVALAVGLWTQRERSGRRRPWFGATAISVLATTALAVSAISGVLAGATVAAFGLAAVGIAEGAARRTALGPAAVAASALVGIGSHPFGDLVTGEPPALLYPFDVALLGERIALHADPTLHLLGAFGVELAATWLGVAVAFRLYRIPLRARLAPRATLGAGYAAGALLIPAPTLELSYPFVFSILAVGLLGVAPRIRTASSAGEVRVRLPDRARAAMTALAAVTVAWAAYSAAYLLL